MGEIIDLRGSTSSRTGITQPSAGEIRAKALGDVIDRWRLSQGYQPLSDADHNALVAVWAEILDAALVPPEHYLELYKRAMVTRAARIADGREVGPLKPEDLVAHWMPLKDELERKAIEARRRLPESAESVCQRCYGSGWEVVPGKGARRCGHSVQV